VALHRLGDLELGADPVGRGDEDRIPEPGRLEVEQRAEPAEPGVGSRPRRGARERGDRPDERGGGVGVDACVLVAAPVNMVLAPAKMLNCARLVHAPTTVWRQKNTRSGTLCNDS
jgi:hypothetical protein